jgi:hypothetical protein
MQENGFKTIIEGRRIFNVKRCSFTSLGLIHIIVPYFVGNKSKMIEWE